MIAGHAVEPRENAPLSSLGISQSSLQLVFDAMVNVCNAPGGTVYNSHMQILDPQMAMGGKTGTAQVHHLAVSEHYLEGFRKVTTLPWKMRDNALFIGFAPTYAPRFACSVIVEHAGFGASNAAPIARDVLIEVQKKYPGTVAAATPCCGHEHEHG